MWAKATWRRLCTAAKRQCWCTTPALCCMRPCCTPLPCPFSDTRCLSSLPQQPACSQLARKGKSLLSLVVAQNLGCSKQPPVVATHSNTNNSPSCDAAADCFPPARLPASGCAEGGEKPQVCQGKKKHLPPQCWHHPFLQKEAVELMHIGLSGNKPPHERPSNPPACGKQRLS